MHIEPVCAKAYSRAAPRVRGTGARVCVLRGLFGTCWEELVTAGAGISQYLCASWRLPPVTARPPRELPRRGLRSKYSVVPCCARPPLLRLREEGSIIKLLPALGEAVGDYVSDDVSVLPCSCPSHSFWR